MTKDLKSSVIAAIAAVVGGLMASAEVVLPLGYTPLDWVASDGRQWIDTGVPVSATLQAEADVVFHDYSGNRHFGALEESDKTDWRLVSYSGGLFFDCGSNRAGQKTDGRLTLGKRYLIAFGADRTTFFVSATEQASGQPFKSYSNAIGGSIAPGSFRAFDGQMTLYALKLYEFANPDDPERSCIRDCIPCRNDRGEAGLWDKVTGAFYGSRGADVLIGSDEGAVRLSSLTAQPHGAYIDTGIAPTWSLQTKVDFTPLESASAISIGMADGYNDYLGWRMFTLDTGFYFDCGGSGKTQRRIGPKDKIINIRSEMEFGCDDTSVFAQVRNVATGATSERYTTTLGNNAFAAGTIGVFAGYRNGFQPFAMTLYSLSFSDKVNGERVCTHNFIPYRADDGQYGIYDLVTQEFKPNAGTGGGFSYGYGYTTEGETLRIHLGTLTAEDAFGDYATVEKVTRHTLFAGELASAFPALTVSDGAVAFADATARAYAVTGALSLKGGARLVFDILDGGNDSISAGSVAFVQADAGHPVVIETRHYGRAFSNARTLISGAALTDGDLAKFALKSEAPAHLAVEGGALVLVPDVAPARTLPKGYRALDYIGSSQTQWIDTEIFPTPETVADLTVAFPVLPAEGGSYAYLGGRIGSANDNQFGGWICTKAGATYHYSAMKASEFVTDIPVAANTPYQVHLEKDGPCLIDGTPFDRSAGFNATCSLYLFGCNQNGSAINLGYERIYGCRIATKTPEGLRLERDFAPAVREADGEIGFWDFVTERFFTNSGSGCFLAPSAAGAYLNYGQSNGRQYVQTEIAVDANTTMDFSFAYPQYVSGTAFFGLGWDNNKYLFDQQSNYFWFHGGGTQFGSMGKPDVTSRYRLTVAANDVATLANETKGTSQGVAVSRAVKGDNLNLAVFAVPGGSMAASYRFYSLELGNSGTLAHRLLPYRAADGRTGLCDAETGAFYPASGSEQLAYGYAYNPTAEGVTVYDGTVTAEDAFGVRNVRKEGPLAVEMGCVTSFASLDLAEGVLSFRDGTAQEMTVSGELKLAGGTRLHFDLVSGGCDALRANRVDVTAASAENPVVIDLRLSEGSTGTPSGGSNGLVLISGGLAAGDVAKFRAEGQEVSLTVVDGALVARFPSIPITALWVGRGDRSNVNDADNWECYDFGGNLLSGVCPTNLTSVHIGALTDFNCPLGQTLLRRELVFADGGVALTADCDWRGLGAEPDVSCAVDLRGHRLWVAGLSGNGTITDTTDPVGDELITNGGFEQYEVAEGAWNDSGKWTYCVDGNGAATVRIAGWTPEYINQWPGIAKAGSPWYAGATPEGEMAAYLQNNCALRQTIHVPSNGVYLLTFAYVARDVKNLNNLRIHVEVDGVQRFQVDAEQTTFKTAKTCLYLTAGEHSFVLRGDLRNASQRCAAIDAVSLKAVSFGELHVDVPEGETRGNATVTLAGSLRLVKEGAGTFAPSRQGQTYCGGTVVAAGAAKAMMSGALNGWGLTEGKISVRSGATFDINGQVDLRYSRFILDGGRLTNDGNDVTEVSGCMGRIFLTADSIYAVPHSFGQWNMIDLNGKALDIELGSGKTLYFWGNQTEGLVGSFTNGTVNIASGGTVKFEGVDRDCRTVDFRVNCALNLQTSIHVRNFWMAYPNGDSAAGNGWVFIHGKYTPESSYIYNFKMMDRSTLDLSQTDEVWSATGSGTQANKTLAFDNGATIYVDLGTRRRKSGMIVDWTDHAPSNWEVLTFKPVRGQSGMFTAQEDGLHFWNGFFFFVR